MAGPLTITCPGCGTAFHVPARVVRILGHQVLVRVDRTQLYGHLAECPGLPDGAAPEREEGKTMALPDERPTEQDLAGRVHLFLTTGSFMSKGGSGACTMCGVGRDGCLSGVKLRRTACCGACGDGNTHPAPQENAQTCAQWAETHGAKH